MTAARNKPPLISTRPRFLRARATDEFSFRNPVLNAGGREARGRASLQAKISRSFDVEHFVVVKSNNLLIGLTRFNGWPLIGLNRKHLNIGGLLAAMKSRLTSRRSAVRARDRPPPVQRVAGH